MADSLDSGSSVLYGRAGSSPASRTSSSQATYRLRRVFYASHQNSSRAHSAAPRFRIGFASAGFRFGSAALRRFCFFEKISSLTVLCNVGVSFISLAPAFYKPVGREPCYKKSAGCAESAACEHFFHTSRRRRSGCPVCAGDLYAVLTGASPFPQDQGLRNSGPKLCGSSCGRVKTCSSPRPFRQMISMSGANSRST